ncbi:hypothetical protein SAICODRAFT_72398 [Saitoella complicata NRRL Y-17804]|uniref:uncharacterized protein n=1 Tax=Saitoella complicata (strain BCRC 22490 / CBS 7301 / JCM 7358 / NBRC 10748 / NRRL Y-17804) TaxID=698492 RepID=UPI0008669A85|nr:uncharacterized protein SAICODRAFT_72398 [Saitoella complicata NRRL Y-17804]ODQ51785.1 hypothetical protein SAICODRAFT_72398 [Saitoella complicata NRRL Y-17804]
MKRTVDGGYKQPSDQPPRPIVPAPVSNETSLPDASPPAPEDTLPHDRPPLNLTAPVSTGAVPQISSIVSVPISSGSVATGRDRAVKACRNCRRQKVRCEGAEHAPCKRCRSSKIECIFDRKEIDPDDLAWRQAVESRLDSFGKTLDTILEFMKAQTGAAGPAAYAGIPPVASSVGQVSQGASPQSVPRSTPRNLSPRQSFVPDPLPPPPGSSASLASEHMKAAPSSRHQFPGQTPIQQMVGQAPPQGLPYADMQAMSSGYIPPVGMSSIPPQQVQQAVQFPTQNPPGQSWNPYEQLTSPPNTVPGSHYPAFQVPGTIPQAYPDNLNMSAAMNAFQAQHSQIPSAVAGSPGNQVAPRPPSSQQDLITKGSLTYEQASILYTFFHQRISPFLFGFMITSGSLPELRQRSPLLLAAICAVSSLYCQELTHLFSVCKMELEELTTALLFAPASGQDFSSPEYIDTVIALCVASLWMGEAGWHMSGIAARLAVQCGLQKSFQSVVQEKAAIQSANVLAGGSAGGSPVQPNGVVTKKQPVSKDVSTEKLNKLRLWYLLFCIDRQQAVLSSRPPLLVQEEARHARILLEGTHDVHSDLRLVEQVELNVVLSKIMENSNNDMIPPQQWSSKTWESNFELDQWMVSWAVKLSPQKYNSAWPTKAVLLNYHYAKLFLNSGASVDGSKLSQNPLTAEHVDNVRGAVAAANSVLDLVANDSDVQFALAYVPCNFHTMLFQASRFLLKSLSNGIGDVVGGNATQREAKSIALVTRVAQIMRERTVTNKAVPFTLSQALTKLLAETVTKITPVPPEKVEPVPKRARIAAWPGSIPDYPAMNGSDTQVEARDTPDYPLSHPDDFETSPRGQNVQPYPVPNTNGTPSGGDDDADDGRFF